MTLLAPPARPISGTSTTRPHSTTGPARLASAGLAVLCAGLLTAACSGPAGHPHADSQPGARRLSVTPSRSTHAAPTVMPSTTPAARSSAPAARRSSPSPSTAPPPAPAPAPTTTGVTSPAPLAQCSTSSLRIGIGGPGEAAGSVYYPLDFTNISGDTCSMYGYPGVAFVSAPGGAELGGAAVRDSSSVPPLVILAPGAVAHASVQVIVAQNYPTAVCKPVTAHWLRVYPPGQYDPRYAELTAATCTGPVPGGSTLGIYVVRPGANGP